MNAHIHQHAWVNQEKGRYYRVYLEQDLFGDWVMRTVWGGIDSRRGREHNTGVRSYEEGVAQLRQIGERRLQRGYAAVA